MRALKDTFHSRVIQTSMYRNRLTTLSNGNTSNASSMCVGGIFSTTRSTYLYVSGVSISLNIAWTRGWTGTSWPRRCACSRCSISASAVCKDSRMRSPAMSDSVVALLTDVASASAVSSCGGAALSYIGSSSFSRSSSKNNGSSVFSHTRILRSAPAVTTTRPWCPVASAHTSP